MSDAYAVVQAILNVAVVVYIIAQIQHNKLVERRLDICGQLFESTEMQMRDLSIEVVRLHQIVHLRDN